MTREEKSQEIENLKSLLSDVGTFYVADISGLNAETTSALRRLCASREVKLSVVKNN